MSKITKNSVRNSRFSYLSPEGKVALIFHYKLSTTGKENCESGTPSGCVTTFSIILHTRDNYALTKQKSTKITTKLRR